MITGKGEFFFFFSGGASFLKACGHTRFLPRISFLGSDNIFPWIGPVLCPMNRPHVNSITASSGVQHLRQKACLCGFICLVSREHNI